MKPDELRVGKERVAVVKIDYEKNSITLARALEWEKDAPVTLDYAGKAPDIGPYEFGQPLPLYGPRPIKK